MKNLFFRKSADQCEVVARFGEARLVRYENGAFELLGGGPQDHFDAREWASLFLHDAVLNDPPHAWTR
jgi:hypothetical protein